MKYWLPTLPEDTPINELVAIMNHRWRIERDCQDLRQEPLGTTKAAAGADFIIVLRCTSRPTAF